MKTNMKRELIKRVKELLDEDYTEINIKIIDEGFIINPTKITSHPRCKGESQMKILVSTTEYSIIIDLDKASLWEWMTCLEEQYPLKKENCKSRLRENSK